MPSTSLTPLQGVPPESTLFEHGERVDVQNRFTSSWSTGFEVDEIVPEGESQQLRLRRLSDQAVLPVLFAENEVRKAG